MTPEVGMGATVTIWTDRYPATVERVSPSGKVVWLRRDRYVLVAGSYMDEHQEYLIEPDPAGSVERASLRKNGRWKMAGVRTRAPGGTVSFGHQSAYSDPSF